MQSFLSRTISLSAIASLQVGLLAAIPSSPAIANPFSRCAAELTSSGLSPTDASAACGAAFNPEELSLCVSKINSLELVAANNILTSCFKVRRPMEMASCVLDINKNTESSDADSVLDFCGRSLEPVSFSQCVVGLANQLSLAPFEAMDSCINTEDFTQQISSNSN